MKYMGDEIFWDNKFSQRGNKPLQPEGSLVKYVKLLKMGSVLDIACGDGRNSLYLLEKGFEVKGVDFSIEALNRLNFFADEREYSISTNQIDFNQSDCLSSLGVFDNVVICHYRLMREQMKELKNHISKDGILYITGFGQNHECDERIKKEDLISKNDVEVLYEFFELIKYEEEKDSRGFFVTYIFKRLED